MNDNCLIKIEQLKKHPLAPADRAFASAVFYSVLEHRNTLDYILNQLKIAILKSFNYNHIV